MTLLQLNKRQHSLLNLASEPLLTTPEKKEDVLALTDAAASLDMLQDAKRTMEVSIEAKNSVLYM